MIATYVGCNLYNLETLWSLYEGQSKISTQHRRLLSASWRIDKALSWRLCISLTNMRVKAKYLSGAGASLA
jgi:hypothetical protein